MHAYISRDVLRFWVYKVSTSPILPQLVSTHIQNTTTLIEMSRFIFSLLFIFSLIYVSQSQSKRFCGDRIPETLSLICYTHPKRTGNYRTFDRNYEDSNENDLAYPFLSKELANSFIQRRATRMGVVEECCNKPCTIEHLKQYCYNE